MTATVAATGMLNEMRVLQHAIHQAAQLALKTAIETAEKSAKATTLFQDRTGVTRASIESQVTEGDSGFVRAGGASGFLENGTRFMAARPFMTVARMLGEQTLDYGLELYVNEAISLFNGT